MRLRRVDQLLSSLGYCARSDVQAWCQTGRLTLGGRKLERPSERVDPAAVRVDGEPLEHPGGLLVALHKPLGFVCSHEPRDGRLVYELVPPRWTRRTPPLTTVGRLDKDTTGLVLLTDVGALVHQMTSPKHHVEKTYQVVLDEPVASAHVEAFSRGLLLDGEAQPTLPATLRAVAPREAEVTLTEGRYHQVRRMFAACGLHVLALHRTRFGAFSLDSLPEGQWRLEPLQ